MLLKTSARLEERRALGFVVVDKLGRGLELPPTAWPPGKGQRLPRILGLRRAVAIDHVMRDLAALREKSADNCLRVWSA
jgi:hypothetical protein